MKALCRIAFTALVAIGCSVTLRGRCLAAVDHEPEAQWVAAAFRVAKGNETVTVGSALGLGVRYVYRVGPGLGIGAAYFGSFSSSGVLGHGADVFSQVSLFGQAPFFEHDDTVSLKLRQPLEIVCSGGVSFRAFDLDSATGKVDPFRLRSELPRQGMSVGLNGGLGALVAWSDELRVSARSGFYIGKISGNGSATLTQIWLGIGLVRKL